MGRKERKRCWGRRVLDRGQGRGLVSQLRKWLNPEGQRAPAVGFDSGRQADDVLEASWGVVSGRGEHGSWVMTKGWARGPAFVRFRRIAKFPLVNPARPGQPQFLQCCYA